MSPPNARVMLSVRFGVVDVGAVEVGVVVLGRAVVFVA
jgi:hypothetical protein